MHLTTLKVSKFKKASALPYLGSISKLPQEVLNELHRSQESAYTLRDYARLHYTARAKLCSKLLKYPNVEDYAVSIYRTSRIHWPVTHCCLDGFKGAWWEAAVHGSPASNGYPKHLRYSRRPHSQEHRQGMMMICRMPTSWLWLRFAPRKQTMASVSTDSLTRSAPPLIVNHLIEPKHHFSN